MEYFLPFWKVFGPKPVYDEAAIQRRIQNNDFKRINVGEKKLLADKNDEEVERLTGVQLALLGASGYAVSVKSGYRTEGATYEERRLNFTIHCPLNGGGILRVADCPLDIANPTFDPHATFSEKNYQDLTLLEAFNRTHRLRTDDIEERKRKRIAEAEANIRAGEGLGSGESRLLKR